MRVLVVVALLAAVQQPVAWRAIDLRAKDVDIDGRSCHWDAASSRAFRIGTGNHVEVNCEAALFSSVLRCDPPGFEPRDETAGSLCDASSIDFDSATAALVTPSAPVEMRLSWIRLFNTELSITVRATRVFAAGSRVEVPIAEPSLLRIAPVGGSPRTLLASTVLTQRAPPIRLDPTTGEIFGSQQKGVVEPISIEVMPPGRRVGQAYRAPWFSAPDLPAGRYTLTRIYAGGVRTSPVPVSVRARWTADVPLPVERVGGARIEADQFLCVPESRFELTPIAGLTDKAVVVTSATPCTWTIGGLLPGRYHARIIPDPTTGTPADLDITIAAQEWSDARLSPAPVIVRGRILVLGRPLVERELRFVESASTTGETERVTTNPNGEFVIGLPADGLFNLSFDTQPLGTRVFHPEFVRGENRYDLDVTGASLIVRVTEDGVAPAKVVTIRIRGSRDTIERTITQFDHPVQFDGLPFGNYIVSARNTNGLQSLDQPITLSEKLSIATVWLDVSHERRVLRVQTESGQPIRQATILVASGASESLEVSSGLFPIPPLAVRTPVFVTALGFSPTCILLTGANEEQATMFAHIAAVELRFPHGPGETAKITGDLFGIPWASCPVPLDKTDAQVAVHRDYDSVLLHLPIGQMQIERAGVRQIFDVPGFPVVIR